MLVYKLPILIGKKPAIIHINSHDLSESSIEYDDSPTKNPQTRKMLASVRRSYSHSSIKSISEMNDFNNNDLIPGEISIYNSETYEEHLKMIDHLKKTIQNLNSQLEKNENSYDTSMDELENQRKENKALTERIDGLQKHLKSMKEEADEMTESIKKHQSNEEKMNETIANLRNKCKSYEKTIDKNQDEISKINRICYEDQKKLLATSEQFKVCKVSSSLVLQANYIQFIIFNLRIFIEIKYRHNCRKKK